MKLKTFISLFCLIVLMFQLLPIKQLGSLLFSNQIQEELPHSPNDLEKDLKGKLDFKKDFCCGYQFAQANYIRSNTNRYIHFATALPLAHTGEIQTPPPNIFL